MTKGLTIPSRNGIIYKHLTIGALAILFLLAAILLFRHTPANAGPPPPPSYPTPSPTTTVPFTATDKLLLSTRLQPAQESELGKLDESMHVLFPAGVVSSPRFITLTLGTVGMLPRRLDLIGPAFQLETDQPGERTALRPFTIMLRYTSTHAVGNVVIVEWSPDGKWLPLPTQVNTATQTATASGLHFTAYAVVLQSAGYVLPQRAIVVDDMSSGFVEHSTPANWHIAPPPDGVYYAGQAHWTYSSVSAEDNWAAWTPPAPLDGDYLVVAFIPSQRASTQHARYKIHHNGKIDTVEISQAMYLGDWTILGLFDFTTSTDSHVSLSDVTGEDGWYIAFDAVAFISANVGPPSGGMVVDDASSGFVRQGPAGYWYIGPPPPAIYYAGQSYWTLNNFSVQQNWATWTPATPLDGNYQVWAFVPSYHSDTRSAKYQVYHNGQVDNVELNQSRYLGDWVRLGVFDFTAATAGYVWLSDVTGETAGSRHVAFDAVAFTLNNLYLPLVLRNYPPRQDVTGVHLGNHPNATTDWSREMLQPIDGGKGGVWPRAVAVQSKQLYNIWRVTTPPCHQIAGADFWLAQDSNIRDYLKRATQSGVIVIIRITPSPGNLNFEEAKYGTNGWWPPENRTVFTRTMIAQPGARPTGLDYCDGRHEWFRAVDDLAKEMQAIYDLNLREGWPAGSFYFEPANEPNLEWYTDNTDPKNSEQESWEAMDAYFTSLITYIRANHPQLRVLTPSMSQGQYAEGYDWGREYTPPTWNFCPRQTIGPDEKTGYEIMQNTYQWKSNWYNGYSWHNYYIQGREVYTSCEQGGFHVSYHFPDFMRTPLTSGDSPGFATEVDLCSWNDAGDWSPQCYNLNPIHRKTDNSQATADSLASFIGAERPATAVILWLLHNDDSNKPEFDWHEIYDEQNNRPYQWFTLLWDKFK